MNEIVDEIDEFAFEKLFYYSYAVFKLKNFEWYFN